LSPRVKKLQGKLVIAFGKATLLLQFDSGYRFFARGSRADLRDDGVECDAGCIECDAGVASIVVVVDVDVDDVDAVCVGNGTMSMDVFAVVVGGAGDDGIIDARRLRDTVGGGGISNESSVMRGVGGARDCSSCCRALSVLG